MTRVPETPLEKHEYTQTHMSTFSIDIMILYRNYILSSYPKPTDYRKCSEFLDF